MSDTITVKKRNETGSLRMKRMRQTGQIPAVLYGHGEGTVMLSALGKEVDKVVEAGHQIIQLTGDEAGSALIKDVQWDAFGDTVLHLDFARIDANEKVEVHLQLRLHGEAPGEKDGGVVQVLQHEIVILCPANKVPENIVVEVGELELDGVISASDLKLPEGAELTGNPDDTIATCAEPTEVVEVEADAEADAEAPAEATEEKSDE